MKYLHSLRFFFFFLERVFADPYLAINSRASGSFMIHSYSKNGNMFGRRCVISQFDNGGVDGRFRGVES